VAFDDVSVNNKHILLMYQRLLGACVHIRIDNTAHQHTSNRKWLIIKDMSGPNQQTNEVRL